MCTYVVLEVLNVSVLLRCERRRNYTQQILKLETVSSFNLPKLPELLSKFKSQ